MTTKLTNLIKNSTLLRYIFVGGTSYAIELTALLSLVHLLRLDTSVAVSVGFWLGLVISFIMQKFLAFSDNDTQVKRLTIQSLYYAILVLINYGFTLAFVHFFAPLMTLFVARTIALIITTGWNYIVYKKLIFVTPKPKDRS